MPLSADQAPESTVPPAKTAGVPAAAAAREGMAASAGTPREPDPARLEAAVGVAGLDRVDECYVYYRAHRDDEARVLASVGALHDRLRLAQPGLETRLLRRPEAHDGLHTWMEVYRHTMAPLDVAALEAVAEAATAHWRVGDRHVERFACAWSR